MPSEKRSVLGKRSLTDRDAFAFYRDNARHRTMENISRFEDYRKIVYAFYNKIGEKMVQKKGGVFIGGFGYFVVLLDPRRKVSKPTYLDDDKFYLNAHTNSMVYYPAFIPMNNSVDMRGFVMDRAFVRGLRYDLSQELKSGKKYTNHYALLLSTFRKKKKYD